MMAKLINDEKNIVLEINLINDERVDIDNSRPDYQNWIPFEFKINIQDEILEYSPMVALTFSIGELTYLTKELCKIISIKEQKQQLTKSFEYTSSEYLFDITLYETGEIELIYVDMWFNMGSLTNGQVSGFSKGIRFLVRVEDLKKFNDELNKQLQKIITTQKIMKSI